MNKCKSFLSLFLVLVMVLTLMPVSAYADDPPVPVASGSCGESLNWTLDADGVLTINGSGAMNDFPENRPWSDYAEDITYVVLPEGLTTIGTHAFSDFTTLEEIILPNGLKEIGYYAFSFCENLTDISLPDSLETLGKNAFFFCSALSSITVPSKITSIPTSAFEYCTSLASAVLPDGIKEICENAFFCCALTGLDLPDGLEVIGENALGGNPFTTIDLPDSTQTIGPWAFQGTGLTSITLPDGIETIEQGTFAACQSLTSITIPGSVALIGENAFNSCSNLAAVTFVGTEDEKNQMTVESGNDPLLNAEWTCTLAGRGTCGAGLSWTLDKNGLLTISGTGAMDDYTSLNPAPWESFNDSITSVIIGNGVTSVGNYAFNGKDEGSEQYYNLSSVSIGPDVTAIGDYAFYHCKALTSAAMPDGLTEIGSGAFMGCAFESVDLPDGLEKIGSAAFAQCEDLTSISIPGSVSSIGAEAFSYSPALASLVLEEGTTEIPGYCFTGDSSLTSVLLPESLEEIGDGAFSECGSLASVSLPENLVKIGDGAFSECPALSDVYYPGSSDDWDTVSVGSGNECLLSAEIHFNETLYTISYVLDGGTNSSLNPASYTNLTDTITLAEPTKKGFSFCGWYSSSDFTDQVTEIPMGSSGNRTLYAKWEEKDETAVAIPDYEECGLSVGATVYVDGRPCTLDNDGTVTIPEGGAAVITSYSTKNISSSDVHEQYPTDMKVWRLINTDGTWTAERISEMDNILQYAGTSIRITGKKGIRMITGITPSSKAALTSTGLAGYTLKEYGTLLCFSSEMADGSLVLSDSYARSNYAYKKGVADPVFAQTSSQMQYTNVLVGFTDEQCDDDIAMRSYMILQDSNGEQITVYGGIVIRSIGYVAYQNRNVFSAGSDAYEYIWHIIHAVYGNKYDSEYKK